VIKVNLLNGFTGGTTVQSPTGTVAAVGTSMGSSGTSLGPGAPAEVLVRLVVVVIPLLLIIGLDYYFAEQRNREAARVLAELTEAQGRLETLKPQVEAVKKFQENKKQLQDKIDVIRRISKERLKNVKALDALHSIVPAKAWLTKLTIKDNRCALEGEAIEDIDVSQLMQGLEESVFFASVLLKGVESVKSKGGVVKKFAIEVNMENM
jgi:type IV pilus assembly protein PilN